MGPIKSIVCGQKAVDGAGVNLVRVLGKDTILDFDPILMLDSFDSRNPEDYIKGFPTHPHRGIETLTYLVKGRMDHEDSLGNKGIITDGCAQWMTAGSGILHSEFPRESERMLGVQLWINLPKKDKMTKPKYFEIKSEDIAKKDMDWGIARVISGKEFDLKGVSPHHLPIDFYDLTIYHGKTFYLPKKSDKNGFLFLLEGDLQVGDEIYKEKSALLLNDVEKIQIKATKSDARLLVIQGPRLDEPVAWGGPVVMNTKEELRNTFMELSLGTFIRED